VDGADMSSRRVVLLVTSPRLPAGLLTASAWDLVRAYPVYAAAESAAVTALRTAGVDVSIVAADASTLLAELDEHPTVVWLAGPTGDEDLARDLGLRLVRQPALARLELVYGSWDPPGARLLDVVTVMDHLASPGGDPWKREQTHQSLASYLLEEAYEAYDAIDAHDLEALREELGDVLLQVILHARMAQEAPRPWSIDDLAGHLVDKLVRRNPHVYAGVAVADVDEIVRNWEQIKREEKARGSAVDGVALSQPALALATKLLSRARRAGVAVDVGVVDMGGVEVDVPALDEHSLGETLFALVTAAERAGLDAEAALRRTALRYADAVRAAERTAAPDNR
jgi:XTP/dITP diphosphohydrolase